MRETVQALATVLAWPEARGHTVHVSGHLIPKICLKSLTLQLKDLDWVCSQQCRIPDVFHGSKPREKKQSLPVNVFAGVIYGYDITILVIL